jgi:hypothetical protein
LSGILKQVVEQPISGVPVLRRETEPGGHDGEPSVGVPQWN